MFLFFILSLFLAVCFSQVTYHLHFPSLLWRKGWLEEVAGSEFRWWCGAGLRGRLPCLLRWSCFCVGGWAGRWWSPRGLGVGSRQAGPQGRDGGCPAAHAPLFLPVQLAELLPALRVPAPSASVSTLPSSLFTPTLPAPWCLPRPGPARLV